MKLDNSSRTGRTIRLCSGSAAPHLGRCATSHPSEPRLVDAAYIFMDADEQLATRTAGLLEWLPLTKIHHTAFDAHLIGVDPDFRAHVSERLLDVDCVEKLLSQKEVEILFRQTGTVVKDK
jgi:hypothetical protein